MALSARLYVEHPDLVLAPTIQSSPDAEFDVVPDAATDPDHDVYFVWVGAPELETVETALAEDHTVAAFGAVVDHGDRRLYRIEYGARAKPISPPLRDHGVLVRESKNHLRGWLLQLQAQDHDGLYAFEERATREGITVDVRELRQAEIDGQQSEFGLTAVQRETLVAAFVNGYYDEPRETVLEDLSDLLGVSQTAVSGRLRRGSARLIESVLVEND